MAGLPSPRRPVRANPPQPGPGVQEISLDLTQIMVWTPNRPDTVQTEPTEETS